MGKTLNEILAQLPDAERREIDNLTHQLELEYHLYQLREKLNLTQRDLAQQMGISQPTVAAMEKRGQDLKLITLKRYVEALGGEVKVDVRLADGEHFVFAL